MPCHSVVTRQQRQRWAREGRNGAKSAATPRDGNIQEMLVRASMSKSVAHESKQAETCSDPKKRKKAMNTAKLTTPNGEGSTGDESEFEPYPLTRRLAAFPSKIDSGKQQSVVATGNAPSSSNTPDLSDVEGKETDDHLHGNPQRAVAPVLPVVATAAMGKKEVNPPTIGPSLIYRKPRLKPVYNLDEKVELQLSLDSSSDEECADVASSKGKRGIEVAEVLEGGDTAAVNVQGQTILPSISSGDIVPDSDSDS